MKRLRVVFLLVLGIALLPVTGPITADSQTGTQSQANYLINWQSIDGGGGIDLSSSSFRLGSSVAQPAVGEAGSPSYSMGIGFWYAVGGCSCPKQGDITGDGVIDVFDVIGVIGIAFSGETDPQDPACPKTRGDVDGNGVTDVFDVIYLIATAFSGGPNPVNACGP